MTLLRMDHVSIVVEDLAAATAFFTELGLEVVGEQPVSGPWVDQVNGLEGVEVDISFLRTPDGSGQVELAQFRSPPATTAEPNAPSNTLGLRTVMFEVGDIEATLARLRPHGGELVGEVADFRGESAAEGGGQAGYRLCYLRGPVGTIIALAESLKTTDEETS